MAQKVTPAQISKFPFYYSVVTSTGQTVAGSATTNLNNLSITFVAPFDGMAIVHGSYWQRPSAAAVTDSNVGFNVNGSAPTGTGSQTQVIRAITPSDNPGGLYTPFCRFPVTSGTSYTIQPYCANGTATTLNFQSGSGSWTDALILPTSNVT